MQFSSLDARDDSEHNGDVLWGYLQYLRRSLYFSLERYYLTEFIEHHMKGQDNIQHIKLVFYSSGGLHYS